MNILLVSIAAKNIHKQLAPWCLKAYSDLHLQKKHLLQIYESNINQAKEEILAEIYEQAPDILGFSCYIWNIEMIRKLALLVRKLLPNCKIIFGGPEISYETDPAMYPEADFILCGPGEEIFCGLIAALDLGRSPIPRVWKGRSCQFQTYPSPYTKAYFDSFAEGVMRSIENQLVYYESSRGCPFSCAYCLSSAEEGVQYLPLERVKEELQLLLCQGAKCIKFVDRTFNANRKRAAELLKWIRERETDCVFHFEAAADLFDEELCAVIATMPLNRIQFEIGIQSVNSQTLAAINRRTDLPLVLKTIKQLVEYGNCHIHVDLIAGLPYETLDTFQQGINQCLGLRPHMLQVGFLKFLKGTPLREEADLCSCSYDEDPPYEILQNQWLSYGEILQLKQIEGLIDKYYNSGMFSQTLEYAFENLFSDPGLLFSAFAKTLAGSVGSVGSVGLGSRRYKTSLKQAYTLLRDFLIEYGDREEVEHYIRLDCLTYDMKGILPEGMIPQRDKAAEAAFRKANPQYQNIRIERFPFDNQKRLFLYSQRHPISRAYPCYEV